jgi:hypothetical protein
MRKRTSAVTYIIAFLAMAVIVQTPALATPGETPLPGFAAMAERMAETDADSGATPAIDAETGATPGGGKPPAPSLFGIPTSISAHRVAGYVSGGLLLAAGVVGLVRFNDMKDRAHDRREDDGEEEDDDDCAEIIREEWNQGQALRWAHIGLVVSGESLYLYDAATGISLMRKGGTVSRAGRIHRNAFFAHAGLMVADVVLGFLLTNALERGDHGQVVGYGAAHAGLGLAVPIVILGSGLAVDLMPREGN